MFGYITASMAGLSDESVARYRSWYCGLCRSLRERHGGLSRMTLNYDMTFLVMLLSSVYGAGTESGEERCLVHPLKKHSWLVSDFSRYAADMNVLLAYYNLMDDWQDDRSVVALGEAKLLAKAGQRAAERHPRQAKAIMDGLAALAKHEAAGELRPDLPAGAFGRIMAELFAVYEDERADDLRAFGYALGRFIYIMDACMDFDSDLKKARYNPLVTMTRAEFEPMLTMLAAECTEAFGRLEASSDRDIMENILYTGMWTKYSMKFMKKAKKEVPSGNE